MAQPRIAGVKRVPTHTALHPDVEACVQEDMRRFGASRSFVESTAITDHYERVTGKRFTEQARVGDTDAALRRRALRRVHDARRKRRTA